MAKQQLNIKLPPTLIEALRERASTEGITLTDLIQGFLEQGLGLPPSNDTLPDAELVYERILKELYKEILGEVDNRIASKVDERISASLVTPLAVFQAQMRSELQQQIDAYISKQLANAYEQISKMLQATLASIELRIREAIQHVAVSPEVSTQETIQEKDKEPDASLHTDVVEPDASLHTDVVEPNEPEANLQANTSTSIPDISANPNTDIVEVTNNLPPHNQMQLARRWGKINKSGNPDNSQISRKKSHPDFTEWSRSKDPQGIGWRFNPDSGLFYALPPG